MQYFITPERKIKNGGSWIPLDEDEFDQLEEDVSWFEKEEYVREALSDRYGKSFSKEELAVGTKSNGAPRLHEFDLYSEDGSVVGEVKSFSKSEDNASNSLNFDSCLADIYRLGKIDAEEKLFVLTEEEFHQYFEKKADGLVDEVEILLVEYGKEDL